MYVSYWALSDVLAPLVQARAPLQSGAQALLVVPAAVRVPCVQAAAGGGGRKTNSLVSGGDGKRRWQETRLRFFPLPFTAFSSGF